MRETQLDLTKETPEYRAFVEKFKHKKTTDDCYTPLEMYETIKEWVIEEYGLEGREVVRPFWPGADFETVDYPENGVVIDNQPFSMTAYIVDWYLERGVDFFLFAPEKSAFNVLGGRDEIGAILVNQSITFENGAHLSVAFITNMEKYRVRSSKALAERINRAERKLTKRKTPPKYRYPKHVIRATDMNQAACAGEDVFVAKEESAFIRRLDDQKAHKKTIFGGGFLVSDEAADRIYRARAQKAGVIEWHLSERERAIVKELGGE